MKAHFSEAKDPCHICVQGVLEDFLGFSISLVTGIQILSHVYLYYVDSYCKVMIVHIRGKPRLK